MDIRALRRLATAAQFSNAVPSRPEALAGGSLSVEGGVQHATVVVNRRRNRYWLRVWHATHDNVQSQVRCAETASLRTCKDWLSRFNEMDLTIAGTVTLHGRCPMERVQLVKEQVS